MLEEQTKQNVFEWIRDFKDYEIREGLQNKIKDLVRLVELRDGEIMELQLRLDDIPNIKSNTDASKLQKKTQKNKEHDSYSSNY